jgi:hypothetical protein
MRYLLVTYFRKPGGQIDEQVGMSKRIRTSDQQTCNVIIDYAERQVVKCIIEGKAVDTDFDRLTEYYREVYPELIENLIKVNASHGKQNNPG